jgi:hypothetical protein
MQQPQQSPKYNQPIEVSGITSSQYKEQTENHYGAGYGDFLCIPAGCSALSPQHGFIHPKNKTGCLFSLCVHIDLILQTQHTIVNH